MEGKAANAVVAGLFCLVTLLVIVIIVQSIVLALVLGGEETKAGSSTEREDSTNGESLEQQFANCPFPMYMKDGFCDDSINILECKYDGGDCCDAKANRDHCTACERKKCGDDGHVTTKTTTNNAETTRSDPKSETRTSNVKPTKTTTAFSHDGTCYATIGDKVCEDYNNHAACAYDGGDCCQTSSECVLCSGEGCVCHETGLAHCECNSEWHGDGTCDASENHEVCGYDGGDCCSGQDTSCLHCFGESCVCHETGKSFCSGTCSWGGDGVCHGYTNHEECNFDDGDCCLESVTQCLYCFHNEECICDKTGTMHCTEESFGCQPDWSGDGMCDADNNVEPCGYDGGDCCSGQDSSCLYCGGSGLTCLCYETGFSFCA